jgi:CheY-like chemotaxis protein
MKTRQQPILLVEDNPDDVFFMCYELKKAGIGHPVHIATDGQQAMDYLRGAGPYADRKAFPLPSVLLLDLKLPYLNGFEVLSWLRSQPGLNRLPVFVLSGSSEERDRDRASQLGARGYFVKPLGAPTLLGIFAALEGERRAAEEPRRQAAA